MIQPTGKDSISPWYSLDPMSKFRFRSVDGSDIAPQQWLPMWAARFPESKYPGYAELIARQKPLSGEDFKHIGKWKDGVKTDRKWRANVAAVAFPIWMQAASELPKCPAESEVAQFLNDWSERKYTDQYANGLNEKRFGVARATTLLHFLSGGDFPICDSRVKRAMSRLRNASVSRTVGWYLDSYCPFFLQVAAMCATTDLRNVDKALFSYGGRILPFSE
jgi:hypothetical protein